MQTKGKRFFFKNKNLTGLEEEDKNFVLSSSIKQKKYLFHFKSYIYSWIKSQVYFNEYCLVDLTADRVTVSNPSRRLANPNS